MRGWVMANRMMRWFEFEHLPRHLRWVSRLCSKLARDVDESIPECPEKTAGLRRLLEAKDCFVRACIDQEEAMKDSEEKVDEHRAE